MPKNEEESKPFLTIKKLVGIEQFVKWQRRKWREEKQIYRAKKKLEKIRVENEKNVVS
jgi:hypothetical protein